MPVTCAIEWGCLHTEAIRERPIGIKVMAKGWELSTARTR